MNKNLINKLIAKAESLGWNCYHNEEDDEWEFSQCTPAGEDFSMDFSHEGDGIVDAVREYAHDFDPEDHVKMWINAKESGLSGVPSLKVLVEDADAIKEMLEELAVGLLDAENYC